MVSKLSEILYDPGFSSRIRILTHPDPDPGVNKAPDPGSVSATMVPILPELSRPDHRLPQPGDCQKTPVDSKKRNKYNRKKNNYRMELQ